MLAGQIPFECAIGINGRIWLKTNSVGETIALKRVIEGVNDGALQVEKVSLEAAIRNYMA